MQHASNPQAFGNLDKHRRVFDIDHLPGGRLGDIQRQPENVGVGLADVDKAGGEVKIYATQPLPAAWLWDCLVTGVQ